MFLNSLKNKIKFLKQLLKIGLIIIFLQSFTDLCFARDLKTRKI